MQTVSLLGIGIYFPNEWVRKYKIVIDEDITETPYKPHKLVDIRELDTYVHSRRVYKDILYWHDQQ